MGVLAGDRRLHQGRVRDGERDAPGGARAGRAADLDGDELAGALAVAHHLAGEVDQQRLELSAELAEPAAGGAGEAGGAGPARGARAPGRARWRVDGGRGSSG